LIGQTLSHFRITAKLGEGGMGEVWRAEDTKLGREVAIKVLPADLTEDPERLARFEREARVLASLNHPNIAAIYEVGTASVGTGLQPRPDDSEDSDGREPRPAPASAEAGGDIHFLAMELAEGEDLSARLAGGALSVEAALPIAHQIASALEAAHEKGIVHRDLKPANVMVGAEGPSGPTVKVLDFGLAKAWSGDSASDADLSLSPTLTAQMTQAGVILGTASYMSPEQARGQTVDRRADIWAFGVLLLEMLSGKRTFTGDTATDIIAAVVRADPDLSTVSDSAPRRLVWLLRRCLEKDSQRRLRDIGEARILLGDLLLGKDVAEEEPAVVPKPAAASGRSPWIRAAGTALVVGALAFFLGQRSTTSSAPTVDPGLAPDVTVRKLTFHPGLQNEPVVSPDGNYVAYTSNESGNLDIVVLPLAGGAHTPVVTHPADDTQPAWSPDGTQLAFTSARDHDGRLSVLTGTGELTQFIFSVGGDIFLVPALGGTPVKLVENAAHPTWSPDGSMIAFESDRSGFWDIWTVPSRGGEPVKITDDMFRDYQPAWSPNGRWIAYGSLQGLSVVPATGGEPIRLTGEVSRPASPSWTPDGKWITFSLFRSGRLNVWRLPFDPDTGPLDGPMERVTLGGGDDVDAGYGPEGDMLVYATVQFAPDIWELDPATGEKRQVTRLSSHDDQPHLGPDGETLAFQSTRGGAEAIWVSDLAGESMRKISPDGINAQQPRWSPDGTSLVYTDFTEERQRLILHRLGELAGRALDVEAPILFPSWSPNGEQLAAWEFPSTGIWTLGVNDGTATKIGEAEFEIAFPSWAPDGQWIAYNQRESTAREVWIMRPDGSEKRLVSQSPSLDLSHPKWSPTDPDQILLVVDHENLGVVSVSTGELTLLTDYDDSTIVVDYPSWSADGSLIHYSVAQRRGDIYVMAPDADTAAP
jgi:serine/threonine-protein kinase